MESVSQLVSDGYGSGFGGISSLQGRRFSVFYSARTESGAHQKFYFMGNVKGKSKVFFYNLQRRPRRGVKVQLYSFFNLGARQRCVINATPRLLYPFIHFAGGCTDYTSQAHYLMGSKVKAAWGVKLTTYLHLTASLRMHTNVTPLPPIRLCYLVLTWARGCFTGTLRLCVTECINEIQN